MIPPEQGVADYGADDPKDNKKDPGKKDSDYRIAKFHLPAARWFPLVASILAPLATLLDIPALSVSRNSGCKQRTDMHRKGGTSTRACPWKIQSHVSSSLPSVCY